MVEYSKSLEAGLIDSQGPNWQSAWVRFMKITEGPLLGFLAKHFPILNHADLLDVLQVTMVKMRVSGIRNLDSGKGGINALLHTIARNSAVDAVRRKQVRSRNSVSLDAPVGDDGAAALHDLVGLEPDTSGLDHTDQITLVMEALPLLVKHRFLAEKTADIFQDLLQGRSPVEVAERHATSRGNVDQTKNSVLKRLVVVMGILDEGDHSLEEAVILSKQP